MVRFGVLSATFWSIGVDLVAGAVFEGSKTMPRALDLEAQFVDENRYPFCLGHEFHDEYSQIRRENALGPKLGSPIPRRK